MLGGNLLSVKTCKYGIRMAAHQKAFSRTSAVGNSSADLGVAVKPA